MEPIAVPQMPRKWMCCGLGLIANFRRYSSLLSGGQLPLINVLAVPFFFEGVDVFAGFVHRFAAVLFDDRVEGGIDILGHIFGITANVEVSALSSHSKSSLPCSIMRFCT